MADLPTLWIATELSILVAVIVGLVAVAVVLHDRRRPPGPPPGPNPG